MVTLTFDLDISWPWILWPFDLMLTSRGYVNSRKITFSTMVTLTYDLDLYWGPRPKNVVSCARNSGSQMLYFRRYDFFLVRFFCHRQTDTRQTDRRKVMHKSPPCMGTGGLKKCNLTLKRAHLPANDMNYWCHSRIAIGKFCKIWIIF